MLFRSMGALVSRQVTRVREGLATGGAGVGAVAGVGEHVSRQAIGAREGLAAGGASVGAVAGMAAHMSRQLAGRRAGLCAEDALVDELTPHPAPPPLARPSRVSTRSLTRGPFHPPLAPDHRHVK